MKRAKFYVEVCVTAAAGSLIGLVLANSEVSIKDVITLNFVLYNPRIIRFPERVQTALFSSKYHGQQRRAVAGHDCRKA